jgi:hypothetical protein
MFLRNVGKAPTATVQKAKNRLSIQNELPGKNKISDGRSVQVYILVIGLLLLMVMVMIVVVIV